VFINLCGCAGAQLKAPVYQKRREGFSPSGGRKEEMRSEELGIGFMLFFDYSLFLIPNLVHGGKV